MTFIPNFKVFNNPNISGANAQYASFRGAGLYSGINSPQKDSFASNPIYENLGSKNEIIALAKSNPKIMSLLKQYNIPLKPNAEELQKLQSGHLKNSRITAAKVYSALPQELKKEVNLSDLQQAALLHDYGKVLIPDHILNKNGKFTPEEKEIMDLHSTLGYELLKNTGVKKEVLGLIKYHHQNPQGTGYPSIEKDFEYNTASEILSASDKYSALTEERPYHKAMTKDDALGIIKQDVDSGILSQEVFDALSKAV